jgi:FKBP-type peptidyl-prolyl cis-trans isomerase 2
MAQGFSATLLIVLIVVVVIAAGAGAAALSYFERPKSTASNPVAEVGDNVSVNYIGIFGSGPEAGRVFDTSFYAVATDSSTYPKSLEYHPRGPSPANYSTLGVHVGPNTPASGYTVGNKTFVGVVPGFWQGVVGASPNQTRTIVVPPNLGYGPKNPACIATRPLVEHLPLLVSMPGSQFTKLYPGVVAATGTIFTVPHYGWTGMVLSANSSFVSVENLPTVGETSSPAGWPLEVSSISSTANGTGDITLVNELNPAQAGTILGTDFLGTGPCTSQAHGQFIVTAIDPVHGTYTEDFNTEVTGQTLIFQVTIVDLYEPGAGVTV